MDDVQIKTVHSSSVLKFMYLCEGNEYEFHVLIREFYPDYLWNGDFQMNFLCDEKSALQKLNRFDFDSLLAKCLAYSQALCTSFSDGNGVQKCLDLHWFMEMLIFNISS